MSDVTALFPGTFDPVTFGHVDIARRARSMFDRLVVAVVDGHGSPLFPTERRLDLMQEALAAEGLTEDTGVLVLPFHGLVVETARAAGATVLVRGIRSVPDWDYEMQMAVANRNLADEIETVFLPPSPGMHQISGSLVREVARLGGDVSAWVPAFVQAALRQRLGGS